MKIAFSRVSRGNRSVGGHSPGALDALAEVLQPLWPAATFERPGRRGPLRAGPGDFVALPNLDRATLVLPLRPRSATAVVLRGHRRPSTPRARLEHRVLEQAARAGAADLLGARFTVSASRTALPNFVDLLGLTLNRPVSIGVHLGPPRANRKPVVQAVDAHGETLAFGKVAVDDLTDRLVRAEAEALGWLQRRRLSHLQLPHVLGTGEWHGRGYLLLSPVDTQGRGRDEGHVLARAMVELAQSGGASQAELVQSEYWAAVGRRLDPVAGEMAATLRYLRTDLGERLAGVRLDLGPWHGDWTPWNMSWQPQCCVLWDWERFQLRVPAGFDALHYHSQAAIRAGRISPAAAISSVAAIASRLLAPFGVPPAQADSVMATYLLEIGARYLEDRQHEAGADIGDLRSWLIPELARLVNRIGAEVAR